MISNISTIILDYTYLTQEPPSKPPSQGNISYHHIPSSVVLTHNFFTYDILFKLCNDIPAITIVCQCLADRFDTICNDPNIGLGIAVH